MKFQIDKQYLLDTFRRLVEIPSPVGYYVQLNPALEQLASALGHTVTYDHKSTAYIP